MTHILHPARRRSLVGASLAALMTVGMVAPASAQAAPSAQIATSSTATSSAAASSAAASSVPAPLTASASLASLSTLASGRASWSAGQAAANRALSQVGSRYQWGATGSWAYDCSGLTSTSWAAAGVTIPRTSRAQSNATRSISRSNLQPGDLVFFGSPVRHVEMYVGNGRLVGASASQGRVATSQLDRRSNIVGYGRP